MKSLYITIILYISPVILHAQILGPGDLDVMGIGLGASEMAEEIPVNDVDDIWYVPTLTEDRSVVWVHGLGGHGDFTATDETNSWITASSESELNYQLQSRRPDYTDVALDYAAVQLRTILEDYELTDDAYVIAHSQGGIVSRELDKLIDENTWDRTFQGVVTFGTPHQGAMILNNRDELQEMIGGMCSALGEGPWLDTFSDGTFFVLLSLLSGIDNASDEVCDLLVEKLLPFVFDLDAYYAGITEGYYVGSEELEELNSYTPDIPYVAFWGEESDPVMWNTLVHVMPGREPNSEIYGPFGANNDDYLTNQVNELCTYYYTNYELHDELKNTLKGMFLEFFDFIIPDYVFGWSPDIYTHDELSKAWHKGYDWLNNANYNWEVLIGAREYVYTEVESCLCIDYYDGIEQWYTEADLEDITCSEIEAYWEPTSLCDEVISIELVDIIHKINDGIVLKESAENVPNRVGGKRMINSNHFSMRNDFETQTRLDELFEGEFGEYFSIVPR